MAHSNRSNAPIFGAFSKHPNKGSDVGIDDVFDNFIFSGNDAAKGGAAIGKIKEGVNGHDDCDSIDDDGDDHHKKRKRPRGQNRSMTEEQKIERRERNREHAKRSRVRKKFLLESLQHTVNALRRENDKLKGAIKEHLVEEADDLLAPLKSEGHDLLSENSQNATKYLDIPDYSLVKALQTAQQK